MGVVGNPSTIQLMTEYLIILMTFHCATCSSLRTYTQEEKSKAGGGRGNFCIILRKNSYKINETSKQNTTNGKTNKLWALRTKVTITTRESTTRNGVHFRVSQAKYVIDFKENVLDFLTLLTKIFGSIHLI